MDDQIIAGALFFVLAGFVFAIVGISYYRGSKENAEQLRSQVNWYKERCDHYHKWLMEDEQKRRDLGEKNAGLIREIDHVRSELNRYKNMAQAIKDVMEAASLDLSTVDMSKCYGIWSPCDKQRQVHNDFELKPGDTIQLDDGVKLRANSRVWFDVVYNDEESGGKSDNERAKPKQD